MTRQGATPKPDGACDFLVWAPRARSVEVHLVEPRDRTVALQVGNRGYYAGMIEDVRPGALYTYRLDHRDERPDPASRFQPRGVHGPSQVVDPGFEWSRNDWTGLELERYVLYEIHVGTFTSEGTFDAAIPRLDELRGLGVTALELMPVAQFPGARNWGYDGAYPFAVQDSYGGPEGLKRLVDACHAHGMAVVLDVVYNHLGPEGNYLGAFGPYFTDRYRTPWGEAVNFDGPDSDEVRRYFIANALEWIRDYRVDALHAIVDVSARPFLEELSEAVHAEASRLGREVFLIAESDRNDARFVRPPSAGGLGLDATWNDDFHHALHVLLTGERHSYYQDYGAVAQLAKSFAEGYVYTGEHSAFRRRRHGKPSEDLSGERFVVFAQNHDQVGNRKRGERLASLVDFERLKLSAAAVTFSPYLPLLFMGEEYGETAPFLYFASHSEPGLVEDVRRGRRAEVGDDPDVPDPFDEQAFLRSKLRPEIAREERGRILQAFHGELLRLRLSIRGLQALDRRGVAAVDYEHERVLLVHRRAPGSEAMVLLHFSGEPHRLLLAPRGGRWRKRLDSADGRWRGPGSKLPDVLDLERGASVALSPWSAALYLSEGPVAVTAVAGSPEAAR